MRYESWEEFLAEQRSGLLTPILHAVEQERRLRDERSQVENDMAGPVPAIFPSAADVFRFTETPLRDVKVVILGQDPYHQPGQADGLAFSVRAGTKLPPSLKNILRELDSDLWDDQRWGASTSFPPNVGDLTAWTRQGVLMLNTALTVRQGEAGSHLSQWQPFTDEVVRAVVDSAVDAPHFILWGAKARATFERCAGRLRVLESAPDGIEIHRNVQVSRSRSRICTATYSPHPSPLSADRGFFGSRPFSRANLALRLNNPGVAPVDWRLP